MDEFAFKGGYCDSQSYGGNQHDGYEDLCTTQPPPPNHYYNAQSQYFCPPQFHPQNSYSQYTQNFQNPYPPQSYQDFPCHSQPLYHNPYPQQYQDPQYAFNDQYPQCSQDYNPPQHPFPPQDYSPNPYLSPIHYTPYRQDIQPPYDHYTHSPSVGKYELDEETISLARRWGVTIVPDGDIEDDGYPMRPSEEEYANNQWKPQEPLYQEPQQEFNAFDQDPEMKFMMANMLKQMNEQQVLLDNMMAQIQGLTTQEPVQELSSNVDVLQELLLPNEGHVVEENKKQGEDIDGEDEDDEVYDECIEIETPSWGESIGLHGNGDNEQLEDGPIEEVQENEGVEEETKDESVEEEREENMEVGDKDHIESCLFEENLKENVVGRMQGLNEELPLMEHVENFRRVWEPGGVNGFESIGPHWSIFISKDSQFLLVNDKVPRFSLLIQDGKCQEEKMCGTQENDQAHGYYLDPKFRKKSLVDLWIKNGFEEGICLKFDLDEHYFLSFEVVMLSLREHIESHHLKCYLEEKVEEKEMMIEEESIFLEVDRCNFFEENMLLLLSLKEFLNARHLRTFIEEKVDGEKKLIFIQTCKDCSLRG